MVVELSNGCLFDFPAPPGEGLRGAPSAQLAAVEALPGGAGLHREAPEVDLSVPALVAGVFGSKPWMAELGRAGGSATTVAARANGRKGAGPKGTARA